METIMMIKIVTVNINEKVWTDPESLHFTASILMYLQLFLFQILFDQFGYYV